MTWDTVPWFTGGGAQHSPEVGRLLAFAATSGSEGIVGSTDLTVRPLAIPGTKVRVSPGAAVIRNRSTGGSQQTYIARLATEDVVDIASTGSAGGRTDLVIARIEDPFAAGTPWQDPADPTVGPYVFTRVLSNVPSSAIASKNAATAYLRSKGYSAIPLAGITLPASTGTVTASMVKSLREMANPRRRRDVSTLALTSADTETQMSTSPEWWPNAASAKWSKMEIPAWATVVRVVCTWAQILIPAGNVTGRLWVRVGQDSASDGYFLDLPFVNYDTPGLTQTSRSTFVAAGEIAIPAAYRDTVQWIAPMAQLLQIISGGNAARIKMDGGSAIALDLEYLEAPAEDDS